MSENKSRRESADAVMSQVQKNASADLKALIDSYNEVCQGIEVCTATCLTCPLLLLTVRNHTRSEQHQGCSYTSIGLQEVINWDPRRSKGQTLQGKPNLYSLKTISRSLERLQGSFTMVPTQVAFEAATTAGSHASESDLDSAVTIHAVEKEVTWPLLSF